MKDALPYMHIYIYRATKMAARYRPSVQYVKLKCRKHLINVTKHRQSKDHLQPTGKQAKQIVFQRSRSLFHGKRAKKLSS
jgi:hypothetical protein